MYQMLLASYGCTKNGIVCYFKIGKPLYHITKKTAKCWLWNDVLSRPQTNQTWFTGHTSTQHDIRIQSRVGQVSMERLHTRNQLSVEVLPTLVKPVTVVKRITATGVPYTLLDLDQPKTGEFIGQRKFDCFVFLMTFRSGKFNSIFKLYIKWHQYPGDFFWNLYQRFSAG